MTLTHTFTMPPDRLAATLLDLGFQESLSDIGALKERRVLSQESSGDGLLRRVRCVLDVQLNGVARSLLGDGDPAWVEVAAWAPASQKWTWHVDPEVGENLLEARGTTSIAPGADGGSEKVIEADVRVKVPLYGGKVEGWIAEGLRRAYDEEADRLSRWRS